MLIAATFATVALLIVFYALFIAPRKWVKRYGDGVYGAERKLYANAGKDNDKNFYANRRA